MTINDLSNLVIQKICFASTLYTEQGVKRKRNNRERWAIVLKYEGETVYTVGGKTYRSDATHPVLLPKGCSYEWCCTQSGHFAVVEFECDLTCDTPFCFSIRNGEKVLSLLKELEYKQTVRNPLYGVESIRDTYSLLLLLVQSTNRKYAPADKRHKIAPALEYMAAHYNQPITNDQLAARCHLSTVYFRKLFTDIIGQSPICHLHELRIKKAKEMLKSDCGSIASVAESLGYVSIYDFSRAFKKHAGVSPSHYQKTRTR